MKIFLFNMLIFPCNVKIQVGDNSWHNIGRWHKDCHLGLFAKSNSSLSYGHKSVIDGLALLGPSPNHRKQYYKISLISTSIFNQISLLCLL